MRSADAARRAGLPRKRSPTCGGCFGITPPMHVRPWLPSRWEGSSLAELGQPTEAADAFALSRRLAPRGPMASHALAREVEAAARGGDEPEHGGSRRRTWPTILRAPISRP